MCLVLSTFLASEGSCKGILGPLQVDERLGGVFFELLLYEQNFCKKIIFCEKFYFSLYAFCTIFFSTRNAQSFHLKSLLLRFG